MGSSWWILPGEFGAHGGLNHVPLSFNHVVDLTSWGHIGGFNQVILVLMVDLTMCPFKVLQRIKVCFEK
jgi:hypothetical protein